MRDIRMDWWMAYAGSYRSHVRMRDSQQNKLDRVAQMSDNWFLLDIAEVDIRCRLEENQSIDFVLRHESNDGWTHSASNANWPNESLEFPTSRIDAADLGDQMEKMASCFLMLLGIEWKRMRRKWGHIGGEIQCSRVIFSASC